MLLSDKYVNKQTGPMASRKFRKERTVYTKEQQGLLQKHFDECQYPNKKKIVELALSVGVTKREIKVSFSLFPQSDSNNVPFLIRHLYCVLLKGLGEGGQI